MSIIILIAVIACVGFFLAVPLFEFVFISLLITPLFKFLLGRLLMVFGWDAVGAGVDQLLYLTCFMFIVGGVYAIFGPCTRKISLSDMLPFGFFVVLFTVAYNLCGLWYDFYDLGERLRDYALLASAIDSPIVPKEPWMEGATLNYYVYWYRFGAMLNSLLSINVWDTYHVLVSFSIALYGAVIFQIIRLVFGASTLVGALGAVFIPFGPNVAGMMVWSAKKGGGFESDPGWWGPSRVIQGAIDEFPAWSFLLGDAHPHYLNLAAFPFLFLLFFRVVTAEAPSFRRACQSLLVVVAGAFFLMGSNAWEVPMWVGTVAVVGLTAAIFFKPRLPVLLPDRVSPATASNNSKAFELIQLICVVFIPLVALAVVIVRGSALSPVTRILIVACAIIFSAVFRPKKTPLPQLWAQLEARIRALGGRWGENDPIWAAFWLALFAALRLASSHIRAENGEPRFVRSPIAVTTTQEIFAHWGVHLILIAVASLVLFRLSLPTLLMTLLLASTLLYDKAALFIYALIGVQLVRLLQVQEAQKSWRDVFGQGLVIATLGLIALPEFVFLDDSYGGDIERMNTIFKVYTTSWALAGLSAIYLISLVSRVGLTELRTRNPQAALWSRITSGGVIILVLVIGTYRFYDNGISKRRQAPSQFGSEGLGVADKRFPGSAAIIRVLRSKPYGRVLETQGKPYSFTSFVSTLAGQPAYLGWSNHVNLLTRLGEEIGRRERITDEFYRQSDCVARRDMAVRERINYIVVGSLEKQKYNELSSLDFSCFTTIAEQGEYKLYGAP